MGLAQSCGAFFCPAGKGVPGSKGLLSDTAQGGEGPARGSCGAAQRSFEPIDPLKETLR